MKTTKRKYEALLAIAAGMIVLYFVFHQMYFIYISLGILLAGLFIPPLAQLISFLWYKLSEGIGSIMSRIILSLVFYIILFPLALISRLFRKDSLQLKPKYQSLYVTRNHTYNAEDLSNIW